jgi:hypothetical protein
MGCRAPFPVTAIDNPTHRDSNNSVRRNSVPREANHVCEYLRCTKTAQISTRNDLRLLSAMKKS